MVSAVKSHLEDAEHRLRRSLASLLPPLRRSVMDLCTYIAAQPSDAVLIFTARKAICLADMLQQGGQISQERTLHSTRMLDGDCSFLNGRRVILVEDIVSSGRTMRETLESIARFSPESMTCRALSFEGARDDYQAVVPVGIKNASDIEPISDQD